MSGIDLKIGYRSYGIENDCRNCSDSLLKVKWVGSFVVRVFAG